MNASNKHFIFVPGSFHSSWCWFKMQSLLNRNGNTSLAIDLPAHGNDHTPILEVTLDSYVDAVCKLIEQYERPVILIGHSRAGIIISQAADRLPDKIESLVYLCAYLIPDGEPMVASALTDSGSVLGPNLIFNEQEGWHFPDKKILKETLYPHCSEEDLALAMSLLTKEPNLPVATPLKLSDSGFGRVRKVYIKTTLDKTISYPFQEKMLSRVHVDEVFELQSGHSPFLSQPSQLADLLLNKI